MSLITELTKFMKANLPATIFRGQKFTSYADNIELMREFSLVTQNQLKVGEYTYDAVLSFYDLNYKANDPSTFFVLVLAWIEQLAQSNLYQVEDNPDVDVEVIDEELADLTLTVKIKESLFMVEDEQGAIPFKNKRYKIQNPIIWHSPESIEVTAVNHANND